MDNELPYFGTKDNPTNIADDVEEKLDVTIKNELSEIRNLLIALLDNIGLDTKQPAADVKIEAIANEKVYKLVYPVVVKIDARIKGVKG